MAQARMIQLDKPRKVKFGSAAVLEFKRVSGFDIASVGRDIGLATIIYLVYAGLYGCDPSTTLEHTSDLIDSYVDAGGSSVELGKAIGEALVASGWLGRPTSGETSKPSASES